MQIEFVWSDKVRRARITAEPIATLRLKYPRKALRWRPAGSDDVWTTEPAYVPPPSPPEPPPAPVEPMSKREYDLIIARAIIAAAEMEEQKRFNRIMRRKRKAYQEFVNELGLPQRRAQTVASKPKRRVAPNAAHIRASKDELKRQRKNRPQEPAGEHQPEPPPTAEVAAYRAVRARKRAARANRGASAPATAGAGLMAGY